MSEERLQWLKAMHEARRHVLDDKELSEDGKSKLHDALTTAIVWFQLGLDPTHSKMVTFTGEVKIVRVSLGPQQADQSFIAKSRLADDGCPHDGEPS